MDFPKLSVPSTLAFGFFETWGGFGSVRLCAFSKENAAEERQKLFLVRVVSAPPQFAWMAVAT